MFYLFIYIYIDLRWWQQGWMYRRCLQFVWILPPILSRILFLCLNQKFVFGTRCPEKCSGNWEFLFILLQITTKVWKQQLTDVAAAAGYVVEKCEEGSQTWEKVPGVVTGTAHTVRDLEPGKKYKFRVKAENLYGTGEPVETDRAVLAKNPFGQSYIN